LDIQIVQHVPKDMNIRLSDLTSWMGRDGARMSMFSKAKRSGAHTITALKVLSVARLAKHSQHAIGPMTLQRTQPQRTPMNFAIRLHAKTLRFRSQQLLTHLLTKETIARPPHRLQEGLYTTRTAALHQVNTRKIGQ
jgi:hypothetical protein